MYKFGTMYWMIGISYFISKPLAAEIFVPFFHRLKLTSAYEVWLCLSLLKCPNKEWKNVDFKARN